MFLSILMLNACVCAVCVYYYKEVDSKQPEAVQNKINSEEYSLQQVQISDISLNNTQTDMLSKHVDLSALLQSESINDFFTNVLLFFYSDPFGGALVFSFSTIGWLYVIKALGSAAVGGGPLIFSTKSENINKSDFVENFEVGSENSNIVNAEVHIQAQSELPEIQPEIQPEVQPEVQPVIQPEVQPVIQPEIEVNPPVNEIPVLSEHECSIMKVAVVEEYNNYRLNIREAGDQFEKLIKSNVLPRQPVIINEHSVPYLFIERTQADLELLKSKGLGMCFCDFYKELVKQEGILWAIRGNTKVLEKVIQDTNPNLIPGERYLNVFQEP